MTDMDQYMQQAAAAFEAEQQRGRRRTRWGEYGTSSSKMQKNHVCLTRHVDGQEKSRGKWDNPTQPIKLRVPGLPDVMPTGLTKDAVDAYLSMFLFCSLFESFYLTVPL